MHIIGNVVVNNKIELYKRYETQLILTNLNPVNLLNWNMKKNVWLEECERNWH